MLPPLAVISNGQITGNQWTNPNDILLIDTQVATADATISAASDIMVGNFNFNLPLNAVITGIEFMMRASVGALTIPATTVTFYAVDNTSGQEAIFPYTAPFAGLSTTLTDYTFGGQNYLFATAWTVDQINNFKLRLIANGDVQVDGVRARIYYYLTSTVTPPTPIGDNCLTCNSQIQAQPFYLALTAEPGDTAIFAQSFNYPDGTPIQMADVGDCGGVIDVVMDEGIPKGNGENFEENGQLIDIIPQPNGTVKLDFGTITNRGRMFKQPYAHDPNLLSKHNANSKLIISNSALFYDRFLKKCHVDVLVSAPIEILSEGNPVTTHVHSMDFRGAGVVITVPNPLLPDDIQVTIPGFSTTPPSPVSTSSTTSGGSQVPSITWQHVSLGVNRGLLVQISTEAAATITGVTYNGIPLTQIVSDTTGSIREEQWYLIAPPVGTYAIVVSVSPNAYISAGAESYVSTDQVTGTGATQSATGTSLAPTLILTTTRDNSLVVDGLATALTPILYTPGAGQTENWHETANADVRQGGSSLELAGQQPDNVTMDYAITQNTAWVLTAVEILGITPIVATLEVQDEGVPVDSAVVIMNFVGGGVTVVPISPGNVEIDIPGGSGSPIEVQDEGVTVDSNVTVFNFTGAGVLASQTSPGVVEIHIPGGSSGSGGMFQQSVSLASWTTTTFNTNIEGVSSNDDGTVYYVVYTTNGNQSRAIARYELDTTTGMYKATHNAGASSNIQNFCGITVVGAYVYVTYKLNTNSGTTDRYLAADLTGLTGMTYSGGAPDFTVANKVSWTDGTDLYIHSTSGTYIHYTISGTVLTNAGTISAAIVQSATWDGTDVIASTSSSLLNINATSGATNATVGAPNPAPWFDGANSLIGIIISQAGAIYTLRGSTMSGDGANRYLMFTISPYTRP